MRHRHHDATLLFQEYDEKQQPEDGWGLRVPEALLHLRLPLQEAARSEAMRARVCVSRKRAPSLDTFFFFLFQSGEIDLRLTRYKDRSQLDRFLGADNHEAKAHMKVGLKTLPHPPEPMWINVEIKVQVCLPCLPHTPASCPTTLCSSHLPTQAACPRSFASPLPALGQPWLFFRPQVQSPLSRELLLTSLTVTPQDALGLPEAAGFGK